ncbi:MAG: indole-3-glycerol phosphate synthase TrpC [Firmicutes bacterium]|nr:indole-3-glycerol phosphate synthase TrpC [Bacillota bacterium]
MILDKIIEHKNLEVCEQKKQLDPGVLREKLSELEMASYSFKSALKRSGISIIAEIKKASPSRGVIRRDFNPVDIAQQYNNSPVRAISVLTDEKFFHGKLEYLKEVKTAGSLPVLRKDFIIDSYQIYQARLYGADAVLLITAVLTAEKLQRYIALTKELGMDALVEVHDRDELEQALSAGADIIGINNRDLRTFKVKLATTLDLLKYIPQDRVVVSESGIKNRTDIDLLEKKVDAVLIGEALMTSASPGDKVKELIG